VSLAFLVYAFGGVRGAPIGAAERSLDGEDHFETFEEGENSATIPGAKLIELAGIIETRYKTGSLGFR